MNIMNIVNDNKKIFLTRELIIPFMEIDAGVYYSQTGDKEFMLYEHHKITETRKFRPPKEPDPFITLKNGAFIQNYEYIKCNILYCPFCDNIRKK